MRAARRRVRLSGCAASADPQGGGSHDRDDASCRRGAAAADRGWARALATASGDGRHRVTLEAPSALAAEADPLRLEQVLTNPLDNAIKYSPEGGAIRVALSCPRDGWVELAVRDWGLGIPAQRRGRIFERFFQAHGDGHRSGLGLGLYVSRQIAELHGGAIRAEFPDDGGTRFVVSLPVAAESPRGALSVG